MANKSTELRKLMTAAMFGAIICIMTMVVKIPLPVGGYVHLGDAFVILAALSVGGIYGGAAAGIGSMFADIFSGYSNYALPTFIIKFLMALSVWMCVKYMNTGKPIVSRIIGGISAELIMALGYFVVDWIFYGSGAFINLGMYLIKGGINIAAAVAFAPAFEKIGLISQKRVR